MLLLDLPTIFKDYSDYIVFPLATIVTIGVAYWIYLKQRKTKEISYEFLSNERIVSVNESFKDNIEINFNGEIVNDLWMIILKITNTGNIPIERKDFDEALEIKTIDHPKWLSAEIVNEQPRNLKAQIEGNTNQISDQDTIKISPTLLNSGDNFSLKLLISNPEKTNFEIEGRISGIKRLKNINEIKDKKSNSTRILKDGEKIVILAAILFGLSVNLIIDKIGEGILHSVEKDMLTIKHVQIDEANKEIKSIIFSSDSPVSNKNLKEPILIKINDSPHEYNLKDSPPEYSSFNHAPFFVFNFEIDFEGRKEIAKEGNNEICYKSGTNAKCLDYYYSPTTE